MPRNESPPGPQWDPFRLLQKVRYRGAVAMFMLGLFAITAVFLTIAIRATSETVQIVIVASLALAFGAFLFAAITAIRRLGPMALMDGTQALQYSKQENASKYREAPMMPPELDPRHPNRELPPAPEENV